MFNSAQLKQLSDRGIELDQVLKQLELFRKGILPVTLINPSTPGHGIEVFEEKEIDYYVNFFQQAKNNISILKFVPASGAASRMFKQLFEAAGEFSKKSYELDKTLAGMPEMVKFFDELMDYPFINDLAKVCGENGETPDSLIKSKRYVELLNYLLSANGLSYGQLPKGLLKFHKYADETRTAFEEHFIEAAKYLKDKKDVVKLHFTVSPEHLKLFEVLSDELKKKYFMKYKVHFEVEFSIQKLSTDTIAVDMNNNPFLTEEGLLLFRPGGHGALLDNVQDLNEDVIFVGNIDNVSPDRTKPQRVRFKELLGGILIERVQIIHDLLKKLDKGYTEESKILIIDFITKYISIESGKELLKLTDNGFVIDAKKILNRPVRVCGMVKNVGEPGGGPFWICDTSGNISKQIVESSQVDMKDPVQNQIFNAATHFNPVDLVCYTVGYSGKKFNLKEFSNPDMAFIATKSQGGSSVKALELPGLWNGSMAGWITFFVDVPIETFSPVKTIFDLLREEHIN